MNSQERYTGTAIVLHWLMAIAIFCAFPLGLYMHELKVSPLKLQLYSYHKWIGIMVLVVLMIRIVWRIVHRPPLLPDSVPHWQQATGQGLHYALYIMMLAVPLSGWLMSSALGFSVVWFGVIPLPDLIAKNKLLGEALIGVHKSFDFLLAVLVVVHVVAALKHHYMERNTILIRMLPFLRRRSLK